MNKSILNKVKQEKLELYIRNFIPKVIEDGSYVDKFDYIFESTDFFDENSFDFIFQVIESIIIISNQNQFPIKSIELYYNLNLNKKLVDFDDETEETLLSRINSTSLDKRIRLTPPSLFLNREYSKLSNYISSEIIECHIKRLSPDFFSFSGKSKKSIQVDLVSFRDIENEKLFSNYVWFRTNL